MDSYEYLVSPLKPDANARFSELENLLERKRVISAYKPVYGENRDVIATEDFCPETLRLPYTTEAGCSRLKGTCSDIPFRGIP